MKNNVVKKIKNKFSQTEFVFLLIVFFLFIINSYAQTVTTLTASGTYTIPSCVSNITIECWAGGGGGGGEPSATTNSAGGGGGGAYSSITLSVTPGTNYSFIIGIGGAGGAGGANGGTGGDTYFINTGTVLAKGGSGGLSGTSGPGGAGGAAASGVGTTKYSGGNGATAVNASYSGGGGSSAGNAANGVSATNQIGAIAPANGANGGNGTATSGISGTAGANYGGGGGGGRASFGASANGGNGANGKIVVTYNVDPAPGNNTIGSNQNICSGTTAAMLTGSSPTGGNGIYAYQWESSPDGGTTWGSIAGATTINYAPGAPSVTTWYRRVVSSNGCTNSISNTINITVFPLPIANAGVDRTICTGSSTSLGGSPTASGGTPGYAYSWTSGAGTTSNPTVSPFSSTNYTVTVTDANACIITDAVFVTVNPLPIVDAGVDIIKCPSSSVTLGGSPTASGGGPFTYSWSPTPTLSSTSVANPVSTVAVTTTFTVTVTNSSNGCMNTDAILVTVPSNGGAGTWTWLGTTTDWFDVCNWDKKSLPDASSDVSIPGGTPNNPTVTGVTGNCKTLNINTTNGGHLNINTTAGGNLNVAQ